MKNSKIPLFYCFHFLFKLYDARARIVDTIEALKKKK